MQCGLARCFSFCVYGIACRRNGKIYVGRTQNLERRIGAHFSCLKRNAHCNRAIQEDYLRFGRSAFDVSVLAWLSDFSDSLRVEAEFIRMASKEKRGYNASLKDISTAAFPLVKRLTPNQQERDAIAYKHALEKLFLNEGSSIAAQVPLVLKK